MFFWAPALNSPAENDILKKSLDTYWDFLALCAEKGIVINDKKFKFCRDTIEFAGLKITVWIITIRQHSLCHHRLPHSNHGCLNQLNLEMAVEFLTKNVSYLNLNISRTKNGRNKL